MIHCKNVENRFGNLLEKITIDYLPFIFFIIALFYSSVGFGGDSSYLSILSLFISDFFQIRSTALLLNICVVTIGTLIFIRNKVFDLRLFWPFLVSSIPLAYFGAQWQLSQNSFFLILGAPTKRNFDTYRMIRHKEAPKKIEVHFVQNNEAPTGLGEPLFAPVFAALGNSLYKATGKRLYEQPFQPQLLEMENLKM